jgi:gluconolactonase
MSKRRWPIVMVLAGAATFLVIEACSETGPDAGNRQSGCIGNACFESGVQEGGPLPDGGGPTDAPPDGPVVYGDPLAGTSKQGSLIKGGYQFVEGPVWVGDRLLFSDSNASTISQLSSAGAVTVYRPAPSGGPNGNAVDAQGRLYTCESNRGKITRTDAALTNPPTDYATTYMAKPFNAPNDIVVRADGTVYFTDPFYGAIPDGGLPQDDMAVYRVPAGGGAAVRIGFDFNKPNGIALAPDGNTLYVVDNGAGQVMSAGLNGDGTVKGTFTKIVDAPGGDGMAVDLAGNLYVAATGGILVFDKTGKPLGTITVAMGNPSNCTFGGTDKQTLFITSNAGGGNAMTGLWSIHLNVPGLP